MSGEPVRYSPRVRELFALLPCGGALAPGEGRAVHGEAVALDRGAWVRFEARIHDGRIADCAFRAWGCPHTLAAASLVAQGLRGSAVDGAVPAAVRELAHEIGAPPAKLGRLLAVLDAETALLAAARTVQ
ncbi:MAG: iron-sulfur cluster assembly scaffold protein [Gammaproteobacteria bacterium]